MAEPTITCPKCHTEIKLTESLAAPLLAATKRQYEKQLSDQNSDITRRETELAQAQENLDAQIASRLTAERVKISTEESRKARALVATDLADKNQALIDLQAVLHERETKLAQAQKAQADVLRKERELDDKAREMDLTLERRVQEALNSVRAQAKTEAEEGLKLRLTEKEETIASMSRKIEDLMRKAEQGSQQMQGEAQEIELEAMLREKFPRDVIESVPKGEFGGDILQRVHNNAGTLCGTILWESKRTKNWSDGWLPKLRGDQRMAKAEIALLISNVLPKETNAFDLIEGVWIAEYRYALPVTLMIRQGLIDLAAMRQMAEGQQTKTELVYQYLTGPRFKQRVEAIIEKFSDMQLDLNRERKAMTRLWSKREEQIRGVLEATAGMYGDLQGIAGKSLNEIEGLNMKLLEVSED